MDTGFWVGLAAAIPLSILANLTTPTVQNWLADRNNRLDDARQKRQARMDQLIEYLKANNLAYVNFISSNFMRLLFVAVLMFIVLNIPFYVQMILPAGFILGQLTSISTIAILTALLVSFMNTSRKTRRVMRTMTPDVPSEIL